MRSLTPPAPGKLDATRLLLLIVALALGFYFWESPLLRPLKLLVVMMHETGHALTSLLVGGRVERVVISSDESGACLSSLPESTWRAVLVYSAGYLGSAVAGSLLLLATLRWRLERAVLGILAAWLGLMALLYAGKTFTFVYCAVTAVCLGLAAQWFPRGLVVAADLAIASFSALYAVLDLRDDLWNHAVRSKSDAQLLANLTWLPAVVWAAIWSTLAMVMLGGAMLYAVRGGKRWSTPGLRLRA